MKKIDEEIQALLKEHKGNVREILEQNSQTQQTAQAPPYAA